MIFEIGESEVVRSYSVFKSEEGISERESIDDSDTISCKDFRFEALASNF